MSISAVNCTPIKPQVAFGKEVDFSDVDRLYDASRKYDEFIDSSNDKPKKKSIFKTFISVGMAVAATFIGGKLLAAKALEILPKNTSDKIADFAKFVFGKVSNGLIILSQNEKHVRLANAAEHANNILSSFKSGMSNVVKNQGVDGIIKNTAGLASIVGLTPKIVTADGNNDGIADIAQEGVNAYKSALDELGVVSDIIKAAT